MANKTKTHSDKVLQQVKEISVALRAGFISKNISMGTLVKETGLSSNSIKTILKGETANIASYISVASALGMSIEVGGSPVIKTETKKDSPTPEVETSSKAPAVTNGGAAPITFL